MSAAQNTANRANALLSTGPRTGEGKQRAARNSTKHGFTSKSTVLPNESQEEYEQVRDGIIAGYAPADNRELALAIVVAETFWRRQRLYRLESSFMASRMKALSEEHPECEDSDDALVHIFTDPAEMTRTRLMLRYVTAAERAYRNAVDNLENVQAERRHAETEAAQEQEEEPTLLSDGTEASDEFFMNQVLTRLERQTITENGFVSSSHSELSVPSAPETGDC